MSVQVLLETECDYYRHILQEEFTPEELNAAVDFLFSKNHGTYAEKALLATDLIRLYETEKISFEFNHSYLEICNLENDLWRKSTTGVSWTKERK